MVKIAVIDDKKEMLDEVCLLLQKTVAAQKDVAICPFESAEDFLDSLDSVEEDAEYNLLFSDIDLEGISGLELGRIVKKKCPRMYLVYLTSYSEYAAESYLVEAYQYILKQDMEDRIPGIVNYLIKRIRKETKTYIWIGPETKNQKICCEDIIYINKPKSEKYLRIHTIKGEYKERAAIKEIMERLNKEEFILVDRSNIINMRHIVRADNDVIYLENDVKVLVSRARFTNVREQICNYLRGKME